MQDETMAAGGAEVEAPTRAVDLTARPPVSGMAGGVRPAGGAHPAGGTQMVAGERAGDGKRPSGRQDAPPGADKPMSELLGDFSREMSLLVHEEAQLAKVELSEKLKKLGVGAGMFAAAAVAGLLGAGALVACGIVALALALPLWLSALIVAVGLMAAAGALAMGGLGRVAKETPPVPEQAMESVKEDVAWAQKQLKSGRR